MTPGTYAVKDLLSGQLLDSLEIDAMGGFQAWSPKFELGGRSSHAFLISKQVAVNNEKTHERGLVVTVFPNPSKGIVKLRFADNSLGKRSITVFDVTGKPVLQDETSLQELNLDLSQLSGGIYFVRVREGEKGKIVKLELIGS